MAYIVTKKPWLGAFFVFIFGPLGFLYYSWKKALIAFLLFFLPNLLLYGLNSTIAEVIRWVVQLLMAIFVYLDIKDKLNIIEDIFPKVLSVVIIPIIFLNFFGELVGGIWLLFLGQWKLAFGAFIFSLFIPYVYLIVTLLQIPFGLLLVYAQNKNKKYLCLTAGFISILIGHMAILLYVFFVLDKALLFSELKNINIIALLLFGYGIATGPFSYMASTEGPDATGSFLAVFVSQISYIIFSITYLLNYAPIAIPIILLIVFGIEVFQLSILSQTWSYEKEEQPETTTYLP
ncbi:MAG: hypothetical protein ABR913_10595 [Sedimentisphaerales bacterium]|jgi:hypothetical protein